MPERISRKDFLKLSGFMLGTVGLRTIGCNPESISGDETNESATPHVTEQLETSAASTQRTQRTKVPTNPSSTPEPTQTFNTPPDISGKPVKSIDTMKSSRDKARDGYPLDWVDRQVEAIVNLNATHVAIGTPYDPEFDKEITRWANSTHNNSLHAWFRGNMSQWEGWFGYARNSNPELHRKGIREFIKRNGYILQPGDIFTPCPEAENGMGDVMGKNKQKWIDFLKDSYESTGEALSKEGIKGVLVGYYSMNGDVATALTPETVRRIGNVVVIDHHVIKPNQMGDKIRELQMLYPEAKIAIGEFSSPDVKPRPPEKEQANFVSNLFPQMINNGVTEMNYWVLIGGNTPLLNDDFSEREVYNVVKNNYKRLK